MTKESQDLEVLSQIVNSAMREIARLTSNLENAMHSIIAGELMATAAAQKQPNEMLTTSAGALTRADAEAGANVIATLLHIHNPAKWSDPEDDAKTILGDAPMSSDDLLKNISIFRAR